jgi:hypothetical protein
LFVLAWHDPNRKRAFLDNYMLAKLYNFSLTELADKHVCTLQPLPHCVSSFDLPEGTLTCFQLKEPGMARVSHKGATQKTGE